MTYAIKIYYWAPYFNINFRKQSRVKERHIDPEMISSPEQTFMDLATSYFSSQVPKT